MRIENSIFNIQKLDSTESTNKYCEVLDLAEVEDFTCYWALEQTAGIGQRGNHWHSAPGMNLTLSLVLHPSFLPADRQFRLNQALSLAICDTLKIQNSKFKIHIKWPNDIYIDGNKICGTLVSTRLQGGRIASAICGIGLNVNELEFPSWVPRATSLALLTGKNYSLQPLLNHLLQCISERYAALRAGTDMESEYYSHLLNFGRLACYQYGNELLDATIIGIDPYGRLLLTSTDGRNLCCGIKEIALVWSPDYR